MKSLGHNPPDKVMDELILSVDSDQNKKLDFDEFLEMIVILESVGVEEENESAGLCVFFSICTDEKINKKNFLGVFLLVCLCLFVHSFV